MIKEFFKKVGAFILKEMKDGVTGIVHLYYHVKRLFLLLITVLALGYSFDMFDILKVSIVLPILSAVIAHFIRKALFPNIDLSELVHSLSVDEPGRAMPKAVVATALILFMTVITAIFCLKLL